jgi:hypothetical protein
MDAGPEEVAAVAKDFVARLRWLAAAGDLGLNRSADSH